jgi:glucose-fructose oxidoreductase
MAGRQTRQVRYAVVGLGHIAQNAVLPGFAHAERNSTLSAIVSGDLQKLAEIGDRYGVSTRGGYDDFERCLGEVDAVYIATPNTLHADLTVRAARAGVHVLCEKPLAATAEECDRMIRACRDANVKLMTAYRLHFEPLMLEVLELIRRGRIGQAKYFISSFSMHAKAGGIRTKPDLGGGTVLDLGIYCINAARLVLGAEPTQIFGLAVEGTRVGMPGVDEMTSAVMHFEGDRLASFTSSFAAADTSWFRVVGTEGDLLMQPAFEYAEPLAYTITVDGKTTRKRGKKRDQFAAELLYFSDCVLKDRLPEPSGEEGAWDVRIIDAIAESARRGTPIRVGKTAPELEPIPAQAVDLPPVREPKLVNVESPHE